MTAALAAFLLTVSACGAATNADQLSAPRVGHQPLRADDNAATGVAPAAPTAAPASTFAVALGQPLSGSATPSSAENTSTTAAANTTTPTMAPTTPAPTTAPTTTPTPQATDTAPTTPAPTMAPATASTEAPATSATTPGEPTSSTTSTTIPPSTTPSTVSAQIVEFRIPAGTGSNPWNSFDNPVRLRVGQILRIHNDDSVSHTMHAGGSPFKHGPRINPGSFADHRVLSAHQPVNGSPRLYDHGRGKGAAFWVVAEG